MTPPEVPTPAQQRHAPKDSFSVVGIPPGEVLQLRLAPDATSKSLVWIPPGTTDLLDLGGIEPIEQTTWQHVGYAGLQGWVDARFLKSNQPPPAPSSSSAPEIATGTKLGALSWVTCSGNKPSWSLTFGGDKTAKCEGNCGPSAGLRAANVALSYFGNLLAFDLIDTHDELFLHATTRATSKCRIGKSTETYYYEFQATSARGPLKGCCTQWSLDPPRSVIGHKRPNRR